MLTALEVAKAEAKDKLYKLFDERGMFLLVKPNGAKYWRLKYAIGGKEKTYAMGVYPEVSLKDARELRDDARRLIAKGIDPVLARHQEKLVNVVAQENTFQAVALEWHSKAKGAWTARHAGNVLGTLEEDIFPYMGARPIADITAPELLDVLRKIEERGAPDMAARMRQRCSAVFRYGIITHKVKHDPAADLVGALESRKVQHRAYIKRDELQEFMERLKTYEGQPLTRLALYLIVLTFVRSGELRGATWNEINFDRAEWRIPAERMKMSEEHIVPLSAQALDVLDEIKTLSWSSTLLFPSQNGSGKIMSENTLLYAMYRMGYHKRATVHGFRATASTILNEMGFHPDVIERQLAHQEKNKVRRAYNHAQYLPERRKMMQSWADYIDSTATAKIVPIGKRARPNRRG